jgi:hypothetical protein
VIDPIAMHRAALTNSAGAVLDPIVAIRNRVVIGRRDRADPRGHRDPETRIARSACREVSRPPRRRPRVRAVVDPQPGRPAPAEATAPTQLFERLASNVLYANPTLRA